MKTIIVTRERPLAKEILDEFSSSSHCFHHIPLIHCESLPIPQEISDEINSAEWIFFTSAVAVSFFEPYIGKHHKIATVGEQTTTAVVEQGLTVSFEAQQHYAKAFVLEWLQMKLEPQKILLPQSNLANPVIKDLLEKGGHSVYSWPMYQTISYSIGQKQIQEYLQKEEVIWTFASPSAWWSFLEVLSFIPKGHQIAVIGNSTAQAVEESGYSVDFLPTNPSMFEMMAEIFKRK